MEANPLRYQERSMEETPAPEMATHDSPLATLLSARNEDSEADTKTASWAHVVDAKFKSETRYLVNMYLASNPGLNTIHENRFAYSRSISFLTNRLENDYELQFLNSSLLYRIFSMLSAQEIFSKMGLSESGLPDCKDWIWENWSSKHLDYRTAQGKVKREEFMKLFAITNTWSLCSPPPNTYIGPKWCKPHRYLAAAFQILGRDPKREMASLLKTRKEVI